MIKRKGFVFQVSEYKIFKGKPAHKPWSNKLDYVADNLSIKRLKKESNVDFKNRILDVLVHPGGPTETRVINAISRELGFLRKLAITINLNPDNLPESPRVVFFANRVVLYKDWRPNGTEIIDKEIRIYNPNDEGYFLSDLVEEINSSDCFKATLDLSMRPNGHSFLLIREDSLSVIDRDSLNISQQHKLLASNIIKDSILAQDNIIFAKEVLTLPANPGEYFVDYKNGKIYSFLEPKESIYVNYYYSIFPLNVDITPFQVYSLYDDNFVDELFVKDETRGGVVRTLPNTEGSEIYHAIFKESHTLWGE